MKLYSSKVAPSPKKVLVFIAEKNIDNVEIINIDLAQLEHKTPEYKKIAPNSKIPALVLDDDTIILETTAICRYLEELYPSPNLFGENPIEIASIEMWYSRITNELMYPLMIGFRHTHPAMSQIENQFPDYGLSQRENAKNSLRIFDKILFENEYVAGQRFTYADIQMAVSLQFLVGLNKIELSEYKALDAYIEMINARPSFNKP